MSLRILMHERSLQIEHITTDRQLNRRGMLNPYHQHPVFHVIFITEGQGTFVVNDRTTKSRSRPTLLFSIRMNGISFLGMRRWL